MARAFTRYVAIGDSLSEGLGDRPWPDGTPRGWADRVAMAMADASPALGYANLAARGQTSAKVRATQVDAAVALAPDLVTLTAGMNDLLRPGFRPAETRAHLDDIVARTSGAGAVVVLLPLPDVTGLLPLGRAVAPRIRAFNAGLAAIARDHGALLAPIPPRAVFGDRRMWSEDRLHLSELGHERVALGILATIGLPARPWDEPLPAGVAARRSARNAVVWWRDDVGPWIGRRLTGRSSGDGRSGKLPLPVPPRDLPVLFSAAATAHEATEPADDRATPTAATHTDPTALDDGVPR